MFEYKLATLVFPPMTMLFDTVTFPFNKELFETYKLGPPSLFKPVPTTCKFATFATPSTLSPNPVVVDASIVPNVTVKLFCIIALEPTPTTCNCP